MKGIFQIINNDNGQRSDVMVDELRAFSEKLNTLEGFEKHSVLVVMEQRDDESEWEFSKAPIMYKETFQEYFKS